MRQTSSWQHTVLCAVVLCLPFFCLVFLAIKHINTHTHTRAQRQRLAGWQTTGTTTEYSSGNQSRTARAQSCTALARDLFFVDGFARACRAPPVRTGGHCTDTERTEGRTDRRGTDSTTMCAFFVVVIVLPCGRELKVGARVCNECAQRITSVRCAQHLNATRNAIELRLWMY